ncbi:MarR family winged helix-turn-helix transcriptional regulator [Paracoccus sp. NSM]|uniref:MarR family winged helix-turn-helix transcriptional regulator n=1 Tax=Paracoccus sp. NSM TaxID=3457784 RepID=UPI004036D944
MLCFDVYAANLAFGRLYKPMLDELGVTYPQFLVLTSLWQEDGQSVGIISAGLGLDSSTLTPLLKRLEQAGLVDRKRDTDDERRVRVSLTDAGRALQKPARGVLKRISESHGLSLAEVESLQSLLWRLRRALASAAG